MTTAEQTTSPRMLTLTELAFLIKFFREMRQWSKEQLSAISGLIIAVVFVPQLDGPLLLTVSLKLMSEVNDELICRWLPPT